jgi:4-amino-4-deoxychorismate lyase
MKFFETIKIKNGKIFHLNYHQERFENTSGLSLDLRTCISPPQDGLYRTKIIYTKHNIESVTYFPYTKKQIHSIKLVEANCQYEKKYLDRSCIDLAYEKKETSDEILICKNDLLCDTSIANIALLIQNQWYTPSTPLLAGTTRKRYLENHKIKEKQLSISDLATATHIALLNAMVDFDIMSIKNFTKDTLFVN